MIIDPPSVFAPTPQWQAFLAEMKQLLQAEPDNVAVEEAVTDAKAELERRYHQSMFGPGWARNRQA